MRELWTQIELLMYQVVRTCRLLCSALGVLILPMCPGGGWGEDGRGAELLLLTSQNFNFKEKLTGNSTECWLSATLCSVQQRELEVSYQQVISNTDYIARLHHSHHHS